MKQFIWALLFAVAVIPASLYAQTDTVNVPADNPPNTIGNLNNAIGAIVGADTVHHTDNLSNTVFKLEPNGFYILNGTIIVPMGSHLTIVAPDPGSTQATALPQIAWTSSGSITNRFVIDSYGDITMKNIWVMYANSSGAQVGSTIEFEEDTVHNNNGTGENGIFEDVIFDYDQVPQNGDGSIGVSCLHFRGKFTNCYFRNCTDPHYRYYGRAVSFPYNNGNETGHHIDSLSYENCTFANIGYVVMQEGNEYADYINFNHCTFLNVVMYTFNEYGWWHWLTVNNSIFVNTYMYGDILQGRGGSGKVGVSYPSGGTMNIDSIANFGFTPPAAGDLISWTGGDSSRHILFTNSSYYTENWLIDYMANSPYVQTLADSLKPHPEPMMSAKTLVFFDSVYANGTKAFPYINRANLYGLTNYNDPIANPGFGLAPTNIDSLKQFLDDRWGANHDCNWAFNVNDDINGVWPFNEDMSYSNSSPLDTAAMDHFPLGDLYHWFPTQYPSWKQQAQAERLRISTWLTTGKDPLTDVKQRPGLPAKYELAQNYPNPFNPTTAINYSVPQNGFVTLKVYNVLGQEVATLFSGVQHAGNYVATFDGSRFSSGVYFYRLQAGNFSVTKKLVLMK